MKASLDQHAAACRRREAGGDRHRRRDGQAAWTGDQQDQHRLVEPVVPGAAHQKGWKGADPGRHDEHQRRVVARERVDEALRLRTVMVALAHHPDDPGEDRVRGGPRRPQLDHAVAVQGAREHLVARRFPGRRRLAGYQRLIDVRAAGRDHAVAGDTFARPDPHMRAHRHAVDGHAVFMVPMDHRRHGRRDPDERADGFPRPQGVPALYEAG